MEKIKDAIIVHGPGRSGTTLLANILSLHKDLTWVSTYVNKFPKHLYLTKLNKILEVPQVEKIGRTRKQLPGPSEAYRFWLHYIPEFNENTIDTISERSANNALKAIKSIQSYANKDRFITKITGFSRYQTISALFENPKILWIDRDPKSVIASYYKQKWNYKNKIELFENTPKEELIRFYTNKYKSFIEDRQRFSEFPLLIVTYEDLVADPIVFFEKVCDFMELPYDTKFKNYVLSWNIHDSANLAYKKYLTPSDEALIESMLNTNS